MRGGMNLPSCMSSLKLRISAANVAAAAIAQTSPNKPATSLATADLPKNMRAPIRGCCYCVNCRNQANHHGYLSELGSIAALFTDAGKRKIVAQLKRFEPGSNTRFLVHVTAEVTGWRRDDQFQLVFTRTVKLDVV